MIEDKNTQLKEVLKKVNKNASQERTRNTELSKRYEESISKLSREVDDMKGAFSLVEQQLTKEQQTTRELDERNYKLKKELEQKHRELEERNFKLKKELEKAKCALRETQPKLQQRYSDMNEAVALIKAEEEKNKENSHQKIRIVETLKKEVNLLREENAVLRSSGQLC